MKGWNAKKKMEKENIGANTQNVVERIAWVAAHKNCKFLNN